MKNTNTTLASMSPQERADFATGIAIVTKATQEANARLANDRRSK